MQDLDVDPFTAAGPDERLGIYRDLARTGPIHRMVMPGGTTGWLVTHCGHARAAMTDPRLVKATLPAKTVTDRVRPDLSPALTSHMLLVDGEPHARLRRLVATAFTRTRVTDLRPEIAGIADGLLDAIVGTYRPGQTFDLVSSYAQPLPMYVICSLMGVEPADRAPLREAIALVMRAGYVDEDALGDGIDHLVDLLRELVDVRRRHPADDLTSALVQARDGSASSAMTS